MTARRNHRFRCSGMVGHRKLSAVGGVGVTLPYYDVVRHNQGESICDPINPGLQHLARMIAEDGFDQTFTVGRTENGRTQNTQRMGIPGSNRDGGICLSKGLLESFEPRLRVNLFTDNNRRGSSCQHFAQEIHEEGGTVCLGRRRVSHHPAGTETKLIGTSHMLRRVKHESRTVAGRRCNFWLNGVLTNPSSVKAENPTLIRISANPDVAQLTALRDKVVMSNAAGQALRDGGARQTNRTRPRSCLQQPR
jgi:hypothetical protein